MKNFTQVNRALAAEKNYLFLNKLLGTVCSPNQLLFAVLVMSIGQA